MRKNKGFLPGAITGALFGSLIIHPLSMVFQKLVHPTFNFDITRVMDSFSIHHLPMAFFFGLLGAAFGLLITYYTLRISRDRERIHALERFLPVCSYCKKIRDDEGKGHGEGVWYDVDEYLAMKTDTEITHGMCPECFEKAMKELNEERPWKQNAV